MKDFGCGVHNRYKVLKGFLSGKALHPYVGLLSVAAFSFAIHFGLVLSRCLVFEYHDTSEQIGDGPAVLVDIADAEAEQFADPSARGNAYHEQRTVSYLVRAGETSGGSADLIVVEGTCAFHYVYLDY